MQAVTPNGDGHIIYRNLGRDVAPDCDPDMNWQVEYHKSGRGRGFPVGLAWVHVPPPSKVGRAFPPSIKFIMVVDDERRQGIATKLVEACRKKWPDVELSGPISKGGLALYRKLQPAPPPEEAFDQKFIKRFLRDGGTRDQLEQLAREREEAMLAFDELMIERCDA